VPDLATGYDLLNGDKTAATPPTAAHRGPGEEEPTILIGLRVLLGEGSLALHDGGQGIHGVRRLPSPMGSAAG
jgi:hypothetical protein